MKPEERDGRCAELITKFRALAQREGSVPGVRPFTKETGEKRHLWEGGLWLTCGAFLIEAGFAPTELTQAQDHDSMLRDIADQTRALQKFPTAHEMKFARSNGLAVASDKTCRSRYGNRDAPAGATLRWAAAQPGYQDVRTILEQRTSKTRKRPSIPSPPPAR